MPTVDVVVIGAGLAGMTAALALAEAGASVEVVARGHAATHWTSGGLDVAAPPGASSPADGVASLRTVPGHPVRPARRRDRRRDRTPPRLAGDGGRDVRGRPLEPDPARPDVDRRRPTGGDPAKRAGSRTRRVVARGTARDLSGSAASRTSGPIRSRRASLGPPSGRGGGGTGEGPGLRPERVESLAIELPGLAGRHNVTALTIAGLFDDPVARRDVDRRDCRGPRADREPSRTGRPPGDDRPQRPRRGVRAAWRRRIELTPFEIPLVPPSLPGLRLFQALRSALRAKGGRITVGEPVGAVDAGRTPGDGRVDVGRRRGMRTIRTGAVVLATGGIAGGGLVGHGRRATRRGRLRAAGGGAAIGRLAGDRRRSRRTAIRWSAPGSGRTPGSGPSTRRGKVVLDNVAIAGSLLAGQRYLEPNAAATASRSPAASGRRELLDRWVGARDRPAEGERQARGCEAVAGARR